MGRRLALKGAPFSFIQVSLSRNAKECHGEQQHGKPKDGKVLKYLSICTLGVDLGGTEEPSPEFEFVLANFKPLAN